MRKERATEAIAELSRVSKRTASVSEKLLESISYTKTPQGIIVLAHRPDSSEERLAENLATDSLLVVLHQINNPVNVGAILRTAEAAGATGVITTRNTSDPFSPKSLRGAMGSAFRFRSGVVHRTTTRSNGVARAVSSLPVRMLTQPRITRIWIGPKELRLCSAQSRPALRLKN